MREFVQKWSTDEKNKKINKSRFKFRTISFESYNGSIHADVRDFSSVCGNTNAIESELVVTICQEWLYSSLKFANRITVLSPYRSQFEKIRKELESLSARSDDRGLSTVKVYTVNLSRGLESDIVILSLVRTHFSQKQAFLDNPNRINAMISQAKERLFIIGAREELCSVSQNWSRFYAIIDALAAQEVEENEKAFMDDES